MNFFMKCISEIYTFDLYGGLYGCLFGGLYDGYMIVIWWLLRIYYTSVYNICFISQ